MYTRLYTCIHLQTCISCLHNLHTYVPNMIFVHFTDKKVVYKRYASLYFVACVDRNDNELIVLEQIHLFVEVLDRYFGNVCELDIIFNFHKAYYILDELFIGVSLFKYVYICIYTYLRTYHTYTHVHICVYVYVLFE